MSLLKRLGGAPQPNDTTPTTAPTPPGGPGVDGGASDQRVLELSLWIVDRIQGSMGNQTELKRTPESERMLQERFTNYYRQSGTSLSDSQVKRLYEMVTDELFGFGPIEQLLRDEAVSEV